MKKSLDLVAQKVVAQDLCVSLVTLWRARQSGISNFPQPVILQRQVYWRRGDIASLEDALLRFEGRCKFEETRTRSKRLSALSKTRGAKRRQRKSRPAQAAQLELF